MTELRWLDGPVPPTDPGGRGDGDGRRVLLAAFEGWNDAGDAATTAVEHLWEQWGARTVAEIDPESVGELVTSTFWVAA